MTADNSVFQYSNANDTHVTQDLNSFGEIIAHAQCSVDEKNIYIYIPCVPHKNNCNKKIGSHDMKQTDSSIIIVRYVYVLTSASMIVYLFVTRSWSAIIGTKQPKVNQSPQQWRGRQTCTRICRFLVVGNIFRLETCMNNCRIPNWIFREIFSSPKTGVILL